MTQAKNQKKSTSNTSRPFQKLAGMKVGPLCLACQKPITHIKGQRQGFLHDACEGKGASSPLYVERVEEGELVLVTEAAYSQAAV